jgi:DNA-binding CsgD family transcriptional regulator
MLGVMASSSTKLLGLRLGDVELVVISLADAEGTASLTAAERAIVRLVIAGCSNKEIAAQRGVSVKTVANQLAAIYDKLGVCSRFELASLLADRSEWLHRARTRCRLRPTPVLTRSWSRKRSTASSFAFASTSIVIVRSSQHAGTSRRAM